jgi:HD-GYP domain-containing protein (c-di-GMP phosphodiesterase class II)
MAMKSKIISYIKQFSRLMPALKHKNEMEGLNADLQSKITELETAKVSVIRLSEELNARNIDLEKVVERLRIITNVCMTLASIVDIDELLKNIISLTSELADVKKGAIYLKQYDKPALTFNYTYGVGAQAFGDISSDISSVYGEFMKNGTPKIIDGRDIDVKRHYGINNSAVWVPLKLKGMVIGFILLEDKIDGTFFSNDELELLAVLSNQIVVAIENTWLYEKVKTNYFSTIHSLVNALEANDRYTKGHSERVRYLSLELGKFMGLDNRELEVLEHAAVLHDIGKIGIATTVLHKEGTLTVDEYGVIKTHPLIGDQILGPINTLEGVRTTILQHHERYDGKGYPHGVSGEEISIMARILSVIDTFDAMVTDRPYRKAFSLSKAKEELKQGAGTQFDPQIANAFLNMLDAKEEALLFTAGYSL